MNPNFSVLRTNVAATRACSSILCNRLRCSRRGSRTATRRAWLLPLQFSSFRGSAAEHRPELAQLPATHANIRCARCQRWRPLHSEDASEKRDAEKRDAAERRHAADRPKEGSAFSAKHGRARQKHQQLLQRKALTRPGSESPFSSKGRGKGWAPGT